jgi:nitrogen fixation NifU-like protein
MSSLYGEVVQEHSRRPRNQGALEAPHVAHEGVNPLCGDKVRIELRFEGDRIAAAGFTAEACMVATAAASLLTELVQGRSREEAAALTEDQLVDALRAPLRPSRRKCATLPLDVLRGALGRTPTG